MIHTFWHSDSQALTLTHTHFATCDNRRITSQLCFHCVPCTQREADYLSSVTHSYMTPVFSPPFLVCFSLFKQQFVPAWKYLHTVFCGKAIRRADWDNIRTSDWMRFLSPCGCWDQLQERPRVTRCQRRCRVGETIPSCETITSAGLANVGMAAV